MKHNAKENLTHALGKLCSCQDYLNSAYKKAEKSHNKDEINIALNAVNSAIDSAKFTLSNYKD